MVVTEAQIECEPMGNAKIILKERGTVCRSQVEPRISGNLRVPNRGANQKVTERAIRNARCRRRFTVKFIRVDRLKAQRSLRRLLHAHFVEFLPDRFESEAQRVLVVNPRKRVAEIEIRRVLYPAHVRRITAAAQ